MENEQPELIARPRKSKTPLIIGIVVAIHVILIGSAFIIQEIHRHGRSQEQQAALDADSTPAQSVGEANSIQPDPDPVTMSPEARGPALKSMETVSLTAPESRGDLTLPLPVDKKAVAKTEPPAVKAKLVTRTYTVKKGETWKGVSTRLKVPVQQLARDNKLDSKKFLKLGQKLVYQQAAQAKTTEVAAIAPKEAKPAAEPGPFALYEVKKGDTLGSIAMRHAMRLAELRSANQLKDDKIVVGQKLKVQQPGPKPTVQSLVADVEPRDSAPQIHVVSKGETVSELARRYGVTTSELLKANHISDPTKVSVGQKLKIPSLEFPSHAELRRASSDQKTLAPTVENTTRI